MQRSYNRALTRTFNGSGTNWSRWDVYGCPVSSTPRPRPCTTPFASGNASFSAIRQEYGYAWTRAVLLFIVAAVRRFAALGDVLPGPCFGPRTTVSCPR
jgi:hypothetical protein